MATGELKVVDMPIGQVCLIFEAATNHGPSKAIVNYPVVMMLNAIGQQVARFNVCQMTKHIAEKCRSAAA